MYEIDKSKSRQYKVRLEMEEHRGSFYIGD